jgi:hypothetical protein
MLSRVDCSPTCWLCEHLPRTIEDPCAGNSHLARRSICCHLVVFHAPGRARSVPRPIRRLDFGVFLLPLQLAVLTRCSRFLLLVVLPRPSGTLADKPPKIDCLFAVLTAPSVPKQRPGRSVSIQSKNQGQSDGIGSVFLQPGSGADLRRASATASEQPH